jgi:Dolichyl-phosphate-mannose-protein mannosyltransferase
MTSFTPRAWLPLAMLVVAVLLQCPVPVLDEESYLDIASQFDVLRPYDWWRAWGPWGVGREPDAYVYAHLPGFLWYVNGMLGLISEERLYAAKALAAVGPALLLGWSAAYLAERTSGRPSWAGLILLSAPVTLLVLQRGLMPDLWLTAWMTLAVLGWREGQSETLTGKRGWMVVGGVALAAGASVKYSALVLVPALIAHGLLTRRIKWTWPFWVAAAFPLMLLEGALWSVYGRNHLFEVVSRAGEIPRGTLDGRALGTVVRLGLVSLPFALLTRGLRVHLIAGGVLACGLLLTAWPDAPPGAISLGLLFALAGGAGVSLAYASMRFSSSDGVLLGLWVVAVLLGVVLGHNFAAPRYLAPAALPLTLLLVRAIESRPRASSWLGATALLQLMLAVALVRAEHRFFDGSAQAARTALDQAHRRGAPAQLYFTGEWSSRWVLQASRARWTDGRVRDRKGIIEPLPRGAMIIAPVNAASGPIPTGAEEVTRVAAPSAFLRVVDVDAGVGLYAETLGFAPFALGSAPVEEVVLWRLP